MDASSEDEEMTVPVFYPKNVFETSLFVKLNTNIRWVAVHPMILQMRDLQERVGEQSVEAQKKRIDIRVAAGQITRTVGEDQKQTLDVKAEVTAEVERQRSRQCKLKRERQAKERRKREAEQKRDAKIVARAMEKARLEAEAAIRIRRQRQQEKIQKERAEAARRNRREKNGKYVPHGLEEQIREALARKRARHKEEQQQQKQQQQQQQQNRRPRDNTRPSEFFCLGGGSSSNDNGYRIKRRVPAQEKHECSTDGLKQLQDLVRACREGRRPSPWCPP